MKLRDYQQTAEDQIRKAFEYGAKAVLLVLPTGGGKTATFTHIAHKASKKNKKSMVLVHRVELLRQTSKALMKFHVHHGLINPNYTPNLSSITQVASVQTISNDKRLNYFNAARWYPNLIIVDECHHAVAGSWRKILDHFPEAKILGVTATPIRSDGQGLGKHVGGIFDEMVLGPSTAWLMDEGYLVRARVFGPPEKIDLSQVHTKMGDYDKSELAEVVDKPKIIGDAVEHYRKLTNKMPAIVFCVNVKHAQHVALAFRDAGYRFYSIDGSMDDDERTRLIDGLTSGTIDGLTSCDVISEGTDIPRATVSIELRPTQSKGLNTQQRGRVLRPVYAPGYDLETREGRLAAIAASEKPFAYILDHVGNSEAHGLPHDEQEWSLEGSEKRKRGKAQEAPIRVEMCESCFAMYEPAPCCPECGHVNATRDNTPKVAEGELREITESKKKAARKEQGAAQSLQELLEIAKTKGYHPKWAEKVFEGREAARIKKLEKIAAKNPVMKIDVQEIPFEEIGASFSSESIGLSLEPLTGDFEATNEKVATGSGYGMFDDVDF